MKPTTRWAMVHGSNQFRTSSPKTEEGRTRTRTEVELTVWFGGSGSEPQFGTELQQPYMSESILFYLEWSRLYNRMVLGAWHHLCLPTFVTYSTTKLHGMIHMTCQAGGGVGWSVMVVVKKCCYVPSSTPLLSELAHMCIFGGLFSLPQSQTSGSSINYMSYQQLGSPYQ